jgi:hypothetical protein
MRSKWIFSVTIFAMTFVVLLFSCSKETDSSIETNEFIQRFLGINSVRLYKSEIKRVKVNYFPASTMMVYSFWKQERFNANGNLFLHLYPEDSNDLEEHRKINKFVNLPIDKDEFFRGRPPYFYYFENLQLPYNLSSIKTGQYNESGKTWKLNFNDSTFLSKQILSKQDLLNGKNNLYSISILKGEDKNTRNPILGSWIYQSQEDDKTTIFYNASLNRITYLFKEYKKIDRTLFIDVHSDGQEVKRRNISFDKIILMDGLGMVNYDLPLNDYFEKIEIGQIANGIETVWKSLDRKKLIHTSFPLKSNNVAAEAINIKDNEIEIVNNLISNNLPLLYFDFENELGLYVNDNRNRAYIVSYNMSGFDNLKLESVIIEEDETMLEDIRLQNSFFIKGGSKEIVVHELKLPKGVKRKELRLNTGKKELYKQIIEPLD